jgi:putative SOS response-associated peptidase YedK
MCGRFTLRTAPREVAKAFGLLVQPELFPRFNIAPTQPVAVVRYDTLYGRRELVMQRWGLIPGWAEDAKIGNRLINARAETLSSKPAFRDAFRLRRCLVVADGFFEWQKIGKQKQPYFIRRADDRPFALAGLWDRWGPDKLESCTIITTDANDLLRPLHERMPVILSEGDYDTWLDPTIRDAAALESLLKPAASDLLTMHPVDAVVNSPAEDVPQCIEPLQSTGTD